MFQSAFFSFTAPLLIFLITSNLADNPSNLHPHASSQLLGVFDDRHPKQLTIESNNLPSFLSAIIEAKKEEKAILSAADTNQITKTLETKKYYCYETIIKENGEVSLVKTKKPTCYLPSADLAPPKQSNQSVERREKREIEDANNLASFFSIPGKFSNKFKKISVDPKSYIQLWIHVCSEPDGEVLVVENGDQVSGSKQKQIMWFQNKGLSYRCNYWPISETHDEHDKDNWPQFMSETNDVRIEYNMIKDCTSLSGKIKPGLQTIVCKKDEFPIFELSVIYKEVPFKSVFDLETHLLQPNPARLTQFSNMITESYEPNQVLTYVFDRRKPCDGATPCDIYYVGISLDVHQLDLDFDRGDYLLVGPGRMPQFRKNSLSQIISTKVTIDNPKKLWIDAQQAFLRLVTHNSLKPARIALQFQWRPADTNVTDLSQSETNRRLAEASIPLCLMETTLHLWKTAPFQNHFKKELLHIVNQYLVEHGNTLTTLISIDSIYLREPEEWAHFESDHKITVVQVNLVITSPYDPNYPLLERSELEKLFFAGSDKRDMFASTVQVTNCQFNRISLWRILGPILLILSVSSTITGLFWYIQRKTTKDSMVFNADANLPLQKEHNISSHQISGQTNLTFNDDDAMMY